MEAGELVSWFQASRNQVSGKLEYLQGYERFSKLSCCLSFIEKAEVSLLEIAGTVEPRPKSAMRKKLEALSLLKEEKI